MIDYCQNGFFFFDKQMLLLFTKALLQLNKKDTRLSDIQTELLKLTGAPDKEIVNSTSANSNFDSTDLN